MDYLTKLANLFQNSHKSKQQFLDLLQVLGMEESWEYEEISGWCMNVFEDFANVFDWDFDSFSLSLNRYMEDVLEFV